MVLAPLTIAMGEPDSEFQVPQVKFMLCGLTSSTVLNLLVLPAIDLKIARDGWGVSLPNLEKLRRRDEENVGNETTA